MKKVLNVFISLFLIVSIQTLISQAEDMNVIMDKFHNGLAVIIERNMNNPDRCVVEVDNYYNANRATVEKVRKTSEKYMGQAMAMADKYKYMSDEELEALERSATQRGMAKSEMSPGTTRYTKALESFMMKYPQHAIKITMKAMQFMPGTSPEGSQYGDVAIQGPFTKDREATMDWVDEGAKGPREKER